MADAELDHQAIDQGFVPRPAPGVVAVNVADELLLYDEERKSLHLLDPVASVVWQLFDGEATIGVLADELADEFGADRGVVATDVINLAQGLGQKGLLYGVAYVPPRMITLGTPTAASPNGDDATAPAPPGTRFDPVPPST